MEKSAGMVFVGSGMQVDGRTSRVMVMNTSGQVWVGEMQLDRKHNNSSDVDDMGRGGGGGGGAR